MHGVQFWLNQSAAGGCVTRNKCGLCVNVELSFRGVYCYFESDLHDSFGVF